MNQLQKADQKIKRYEAKVQKLELMIKDLKMKLSEPKVDISPQKSKFEEVNPVSKISTSCIICTKPYYMSPFLEVNEENKVVKILKSSRHGCFEKALGSTKHKLDTVTYDSDNILNEIVKKIKVDTDSSHFILFFGSKSKFFVIFRNFKEGFHDEFAQKVAGFT